MQLLLIVNAAASSVTPRMRVVIRKALAADHEVTLAETDRRGHATELAREAAASGADVVVVLGGDGTLNEAADGLAGTDCALAPLPGGSTNVFARTVGFPNDPVEAVGVLLEALDAGSARRIGLGDAGGRRFLFHLGVGFDAAVVDRVERRAALKRWAGHPLFAWSAVATLLRDPRVRTPFVAELPGGEQLEGRFAIVLNTDPYTFVGGRRLHVTDAAGLDTPLALVVVRSLRLPTIGAVFASALGTGRLLLRHQDVEVRRDVTAVRLRSAVPMPYQVDGDYLGERDHVEVRYEPDVLRLVVPPEPERP